LINLYREPHSWRAILGRNIVDAKGVSNMVSGLRRFSENEIAEQRLKIIKYYSKYGEKPTKEAFGVGRKTIFVWRKRLNISQGKLTSLIPYSTKPRRVRGMYTDLKILEFIKDLRVKYPRLGKEKIYPLLVAHCSKYGLVPIRESTIGKVIKRNNLFFAKAGRMYHNPSSWAANTKRLREKRLRIKYAPRHTEVGHIQMDTMVTLATGVRKYVYSCIDTYFKFSFSLPYPRLNSANTLDFFKKLLRIYPVRVRDIQTDNGLEFLGAFDDYLKQKKIPHIFSYPRCPKINSVVERYQRTLKEEFIEPNMEDYPSNLGEYLVFYNCVRPHKSLGLKSPIAYLIEKGGMSKNSVTSTKY
jgi:transposase InsO family protein